MSTETSKSNERYQQLIELLAKEFSVKALPRPLEGGELHLALKRLNVELPPFLRTLLVADGTVTMAIEAFYAEEVEVKTTTQSLEVLPVPLPMFSCDKGEEVLYREVALRGQRSTRVYASAYSLIRKSVVAEELYDELISERVGIGTLLRNTAKGSYREILSIRAGGFGDGFVSRTYCVYLDAKPGILITETFPIEPYLTD